MQRLLNGLTTGIVTSLLILVLSACGGGDDDGNDATATPLPTATPTDTPLQSIPTWTPVPTRTQPPLRPTTDTSNLRPSETPFGFNRATAEANVFANTGLTATPADTQPDTFAPTSPSGIAPVSPSAPNLTPTVTSAPVAQADPNPELTLTETELNDAITRELSDEVGQTIASVPVVRFNSGQVVIDALVIDETDNSQAAVTVRANLLQVQGQPALTIAEAFYTEDNTPYAGNLTTATLTAIESTLQTLIEEQYNALRPNDTGYYIAVLTVGPDAITVQTVSLLS